MERGTFASFFKDIEMEYCIHKFRNKGIDVERLIDLPGDYVNSLLTEFHVDATTQLIINYEIYKRKLSKLTINDIFKSMNVR